MQLLKKIDCFYHITDLYHSLTRHIADAQQVGVIGLSRSHSRHMDSVWLRLISVTSEICYSLRTHTHTHTHTHTPCKLTEHTKKFSRTLKNSGEKPSNVWKIFNWSKFIWYRAKRATTAHLTHTVLVKMLQVQKTTHTWKKTAAWHSCVTATIRKKTQTITCCWEKTGQDCKESTKKHPKACLQWIRSS